MKKLVLLLTNFLLIVSICADENTETQSAKNAVKNFPNKLKNYAMIRCGEGKLGWSCGSLCLRNCKNYYVNVRDSAFYSIAKKLKYYGAHKKNNRSWIMKQNTNKNLRNKRSPQYDVEGSSSKNILNGYHRPNRGYYGSQLGGAVGIGGGEGMGGWSAEGFYAGYWKKREENPKDIFGTGNGVINCESGFGGGNEREYGGGYGPNYGNGFGDYGDEFGDYGNEFGTDYGNGYGGTGNGNGGYGNGDGGFGNGDYGGVMEGLGFDY